MKSSKEILVIGCGAAGMAAAIAAAEASARVTVLEKNEKPGKKIYITGKGRCNLTTNVEPEDFFDRVITNPRFLYSAFYGFTNLDMQAFMEKEGVPVKVERGERVFPVSDHASDVTRALTKRMRELDVTVMLNTAVKKILTESGRVSGVRTERADGRITDLHADAVILATGGLSYPSTGSTGDGYRMAEELGHSVTALSPSLVPFETAEDTAPMMGLSLRNIAIRILDGKKEIYRDFGEMLFTHFGVSGPVILSASGRAVKCLRKHPLTLEINLKPALTDEQLDARILRDFGAEKNRDFRNSLGHLFPSALIPEIVRRSGIDSDRKVNAVTRKERADLVRLTRHLTYTLVRPRGYNEAIITQGGVNVKEINPSTMESKIIPGLYFAGELIDVDAETGGYNLQIAWSTGVLAGKCAAKEEIGCNRKNI